MKKIAIISLALIALFSLISFTPAFAIEDKDNTKVLLGRGQSLSFIAWKYTGNADNWMAIAKASGLKTDIKSQKRVFVGTVLVIPQELLKPELLPVPSAEEYKMVAEDAAASTKDFVNTSTDLVEVQRQLDRQKMYWGFTLGTLIFVLITAFIAWLVSIDKKKGRIKVQDELKKEVDYYKNLSEMLPGRVKKFTTREGRELEAIITKVETTEDPDNFEITEVLCLNCSTKVHPKNFLSHYFQQHDKKVIKSN